VRYDIRVPSGNRLGVLAGESSAYFKV